MAARISKPRLPAGERRSLIVSAALAEFAGRGYEAASMGRIAAASGVSRTVLYDHFPSKHALFVALLQAHHAELLRHLEATLAGAGTAEERLRAAVERFFAFAEDQPLAWQLLYPENPPVEGDAAADHRRLRSESIRVLARILAPDARRAGIDPRSRLGTAIFAIQVEALHGAVRWWHTHPDVSRPDLVDAAMATLWTGVGGLREWSSRAA